MQEEYNHIDELIVKNLSGGIAPAEEKELAVWADSSVTNATYLDDMKKVWAKSEGLKAFKSIDVECDFEQFKSRVGLNSKLTFMGGVNRTFMKVAAIMIPAVMIFAAYSLYQTTPGFGKWEAYKTSSEVNKLVLADNSEVSLNKNSKLVYQKSFDGKQRSVTLKGEGYFKVAKNPQKPFVIKVGEAEVRVLGTEFNIDEKAESGDIILSVTEGRVLFSTGNEKIEVVAGEMAVCANGKVEKQQSISNNRVAWLTGSIVFEKATLNEVLETVVDHFEEVITIDDQSAETQRLITTKFNNPSLEDVLVELRIHFEKKFEINDNKLIISD